MIWNLIGTSANKFQDIVDDDVKDKNQADWLKFQIKKLKRA